MAVHSLSFICSDFSVKFHIVQFLQILLANVHAIGKELEAKVLSQGTETKVGLVFLLRLLMLKSDDT